MTYPKKKAAAVGAARPQISINQSISMVRANYMLSRVFASVCEAILTAQEVEDGTPYFGKAF